MNLIPCINKAYVCMYDGDTKVLFHAKESTMLVLKIKVTRDCSYEMMIENQHYRFLSQHEETLSDSSSTVLSLT